MATSRSSGWLAALVIQGVAASSPDTFAALRARALRDSLDAPAQMALARAYLQRIESYHGGTGHGDTTGVRRMLDTADQALTRAAVTLGAPGSNAQADSARVLRVRVWSDRALAAWETGGLALGPEVWGPLPGDLRLSPVLEELGENLLRACPVGGILLTAGEADSYAAWYMRYVRGLGSDRFVIPLAVWRDDPTFRGRAAVDLKLGPRGSGDGWLGELAGRRTVCATMGFARPPDPPPRAGAKHVEWKTRTLVWVAGPHVKSNPVAPRDFVFAAVRMAIQDRDPWGQAALAIYGRAARSTPALCQALAAFAVPSEMTGCRK